MKRWAIITVTLYALLLLLLTMPALVLGLMRWGSIPEGKGWVFNLNPQVAWEIMQHWSYWLWLAVFVSAQALLLVVPVKIAERRPASRRHLLVPVVTGAFLLGNMFLGGVLAIVVAFTGDKAIDKLFEVPAEVTKQMIQLIPGLASTLAKWGLMPDDAQLFALHLLSLMSLSWLVWGLIFHHFAKSDEAETLVQRTTHWLIRGSILELLVAVPSHIVTRQREDCCAPIFSFWGIVTGISVMLMSFGPGVLFLFARRMRRKQPKPPVA